MSQSGSLKAAFITALLDLMGFSIIFPLFPQMLEIYLAQEGDLSLLGRFITQLDQLAPGGNRFLVVALFGGLLGSLYSTLQFVFAPIWGAVSDRIGRRPTLLITVAGTMVSYIAWFFAGSFTLFIAARCLGGIMAGNLSVISAAVADSTDSKDRASGMGIIGAAIGIGFILGPAVGAGASQIDLPRLAPSLVNFGVNPFSSAAGAAFVLAAINLISVARSFPETLEQQRAEPKKFSHPLGRALSLQGSGIRRVTALSFLYMTVFASMEFTLTFLAVERFNFTPRGNAGMFVFVGAMIAFVQGFVIRRMKNVDDRRIASVGLVVLTPGLLLVGLSGNITMLFGGLGLMAVGSALANPTLSSLASRYAPADQRGLVMGAFRSAGSLSRALGPLIGGTLFFLFGASSPYLTGSVLLLLPIWLSTRLPEPADEHGS